jgi:hypothetical protein
MRIKTFDKYTTFLNSSSFRFLNSFPNSIRTWVFLCELRQSFLYLVRTFNGVGYFRTKSNTGFSDSSLRSFYRFCVWSILSTRRSFLSSNRFGLSFKKSGRLVSKGTLKRKKMYSFAKYGCFLYSKNLIVEIIGFWFIRNDFSGGDIYLNIKI